jgi:hypothetical protein
MISKRRSIPAAALIGSALATLGLALAPVAGVRGADESGDPAVQRTRDQVKMLDDLYKNAVVAITQVYDDGPPAIRVAHKVFAAMEKAGHHSARLVDATGSPLNEKNSAVTPFEKKAEEAIRAGKPYYEEVVGSGEQRRLMAATVVPAVLPRCAKCHGVKEGELLGFIRYDLPVR